MKNTNHKLTPVEEASILLLVESTWSCIDNSVKIGVSGYKIVSNNE